MSRETTPTIASSSDPKFGLRLPRQLKKEMAAAARKQGRSLNTEIVLRLQESLKDDTRIDRA